MEIIRIDLADGRTTMDVVVATLTNAQRLLDYHRDFEGFYLDAMRWREIEKRMVHQHRGNAAGWTLDDLLPGISAADAVDDAIDRRERGEG